MYLFISNLKNILTLFELYIGMINFQLFLVSYKYHKNLLDES